MIEPTLGVAATWLMGICVVAFVTLRGWQGWLELKRQELERGARAQGSEIEGGAGVGMARIEMADLKERIKKLEAIAAGVEL
jgi:hypothetical protein